MKRPFTLGILVCLLGSPTLAQDYVMVVNNSFVAGKASVALVRYGDGSLVNVDWIKPAAGQGSWNGNCSAQDAVQVGNQVWIGSSNSNCQMPAAIYIYDVDFSGPVPVATFNSARFMTAGDVGLASTQPRGLYYNQPVGKVYVTDGNGIHALTTTCNYTGDSLPGNAWGTTIFNGEVVYAVIASGGIRRADFDLNSLGTLVSAASAGFWPYELDVNADGKLVASGFTTSTGYNVRAWNNDGSFSSDPYPGTINLRGMAVLGNGDYLLSRNVQPFDLFTWNGASETVIVSGMGTGGVPEVTTPFLPYMMGYLTVPGVACDPCDANCDGSVNLFDIQSFVDQLAGGDGCAPCTGDTNTDGSVNLFDIEPFVECLGG